MRTDLLKDYDEAGAAAAKPVHPVRERQDLASFGPRLEALARANNFAGEAGAVIADDSGVLLGTGDGRDPFAPAAAAEKLPEGDYRLVAELDPRNANLAALGWLLGGYRYDRYKKQKRPAARLLAPKEADAVAVRSAAAAIFETRDLVNAPAGDMTPAALEAAARRIAKPFDAAVTSVIGDDLIARNFPMIHAVGRAAAAAPRLVDLVWGRSDAPKVTLVGKGVCFDSGGLDIKNAQNMQLMKKDMGGAANALALAQMIMGAGLDLRLRVLIPAVENAISGAAFRPGDVLKSRKGLTVEIGNTDAEGRLVLADAMSLAAEESPDLLVTLATLTGAARIALGPDLPALFCEDDAFAREVAAAGEDECDPTWRLPLWPGYEPMLASPIADLNNSANGTFAGAITAALFLKRFAPAPLRWAHFDMYAWRAKALPGRPVGGEAQVIRALFAVLKNRFGASRS